MVRAPCCEKMGLKKGPWTVDEDRVLIAYIQQHGHSNWRALPKLAGLLRCGKSCRLRWTNYLRPDIKRGNFTKEEEDTVLELHEKLGNRWSAMAAKLPGRTDNEIKNFWHTHLKKRLIKQNHHIPPQNKSKKSTTVTEPQNQDHCHYPNHNEFQSSSLDFSSLTDSSTATWDGYGGGGDIDNEHIGFIEAFHQIDGGFWGELAPRPVTNPDDVPILNSLSGNDEDQQVQSPLTIMDHHYMELECYYGNDMKMDDSMEFWYKVFVKAGGSPNDPAF